MELCIHIDTNTGFQFDGYVVIPDSDLLDPASYQRFVRFGEVGSLLRNIILQVIDVFFRVQAEIARRANITPDGKKRIYSSRYALSSIVFCGHCGDIYRRIKWNNRGCKSTVWRCVSRVLKKDSGIDCPARTLREEDLHAAVLTAVNGAWSRKADIMPALKANIKAVLDGGVEDAISEIGAKIKETQQELLEAGHDDVLIDSIGAEIIDLREKHQELMTNAAK